MSPYKSDSPRGGRLTENQQTLAVKYLPMARALARPFKDQFPDFWEDFESAACLALVEAAGTFDPDKNVKFPTFARTRIWGALCDTRRKRLDRGWKSDLNPDGHGMVTLPADPEAHGQVMMGSVPEPVGAELEAIEVVESWLHKLPKNHAQACRLIYVHGKTHAETARELGISPSRVTFIHLESMAMLSGTWEGRGAPPDAPGLRRRGRRKKVLIS